MNRKYRLLTILAVLFFCTWPLTSSGQNENQETVEEIAQRLQNRYDSLSSLTFTFTQKTRGDLSGRARRAMGKAYFLKDQEGGKMRWNYLEPDVQVLISDGTTFLMYFEKLQQMILAPAKSLQEDITFSFFTGKGKLLRDFQVMEPDPRYNVQNENITTVKAIKVVPLSSQSQISSIHLWISEQSLIKRIEFIDLFGTTTLINLSKLEVDGLAGTDEKGLNELFTFTPPEGTEIIRQ